MRLQTRTSKQGSTTNISTKEKILEAARQLFNQYGVEVVTVRHIAQEIGISHGNLCYHFPRKEDIIFALYHRVVEGMSAQVALWNPDDISLSMILHSLHESYALQHTHKFLMIDFVNIMRRIPELREHFRQIFEIRRQQFFFALEMMQQQGVMSTGIPSRQLEHLIVQTYILGDFWMSESEILFMGAEEEKCKFYAEVAGSLMFPYLTEKGQEEFEQFYTSLSSPKKKA